MSRSSPCCGTRPCFSKNRWMSSKPAMIRSSRAERPTFLSSGANSSSSERSSSRSMSLIFALWLVATLGVVSLERDCTFRHSPLPRILRRQRRQPAPFPLEAHSSHGEVSRLFHRQRCTLRGDCGGDLSEAVFAHGLGEDCVSLTERVDPVDEIDIELAHVHDKPLHPVDERRVGGRLIALAAARNELLRLLRDVQGGNGVLPHGLLIVIIQLRILLLDDL